MFLVVRALLCVQHTLDLELVFLEKKFLPAWNQFGNSLNLHMNHFVGILSICCLEQCYLFLGWIGFNCGSALQLSNGGHLLAAHVAFNTLLGASAGCIIGSAFGAWTNSKRVLTPSDAATSILSGLVGVTGAAHVIGSIGAIVAGGVAGLIGILASRLLIRIRIDDPVGVLPVHLFAGIWGGLIPAFFATQRSCIGIEVSPGIFYGGNSKILGIQLLGTLCIILWSATFTFLYFVLINRVLRTSVLCNALQELIGNDVLLHGVDIFKRSKHTYQMHKWLGKMKQEEDATQAKVATKSFQVHPNQSEYTQPLKRPHYSHILQLARSHAPEAFAFISTSLEKDEKSQDD